MDLLEKCMNTWLMISIAQEFGIDINKHLGEHLTPLKTYAGNNKYILELKEYCEAEGMI